MPTFNFKPIKKEVKVKKYVQYEIIEKNQSGVVFITPDYIYNVQIKNKTYKFTDDSFDCKGKRIIYSQFLDENNQRIRIIRNSDIKTDYNKLFFTPFTAGSIVVGDIIYFKNNNTYLFKFKKCIIDATDNKCHKAIELWRKYKNTISSVRNNYITKFYDEST